MSEVEVQGLVGDSFVLLPDSLGRDGGYETYGGMRAEYGYDTVGRFSTIESVIPAATPETFTTTYAYASNSRRIAGYTVGGFTRAVVPEPDRELIHSVANTFNTTPVSSFVYTNDELGRRTERIDNGSINNEFGYNLRGELDTATFGSAAYSYVYDPIGNRTSAVENNITSAYDSNMLNQYATITVGQTVHTPDYDDDGNMTFTPSGWTLSWDAENRLVSATKGTEEVRNTYDERSRRIRKEVYQGGILTQDLRYFWKDWSLLREYDQVGGGMTRYAWGLDLSGTPEGAGGVGGLIAAVPASTVFFAADDANGNITEYVRASDGAVRAHYEYDGFGNTTSATGPDAALFRHRFSSKPLDEEIGWYYYGYRFCAPCRSLAFLAG